LDKVADLMISRSYNDQRDKGRKNVNALTVKAEGFAG